ncbi:MAG: hypothetical protein IT324_03520 [Anaerolineae bacterium]|nr:hypothetical protein [Anaerolineae bacterium]
MKSQKTLSILLVGLFLVGALIGTGRNPVTAQQAATPAATAQAAFDLNVVLNKFISTMPDGFWGITPADTLKALNSDKKPFLIDVRDAKDFGEGGFIKGAVHVPVRELLKNLDKLPAKDQPIIVYCAIGHRGSQALMALRLLGYTDVKSILSGFNNWVGSKLPVEKGTPAAPAATGGKMPEVDQDMFAVLDKYFSTMPDDYYVMPPANALKALSADPKPFLLDVREPKELVDNGFIKGAVNIPVRKLFENWDKLPTDQKAPFIVYCAIGHRGGLAMMALRLLGYDAKSIAGGFNNWVKAGLPIEKPAVASAAATAAK